MEKLTANQKQTLLTKINETASVIGLSVTYDSTDNVAKVYKAGTLIDTVSADTKLVQTGGISIVSIVISCIAIIAVAGIIARRVIVK